ncbi:MAG: 5-formyltetrahydrofolate cyclo-ligase, partial [Ferruginibacter sp.]
PDQLLSYPAIDEDTDDMLAITVTDDTLFEKRKYGIIEPIDGPGMYAQSIDLVLVPLLAFDKHGYRVGYGKGYYDKFFKECREDMLKIGFSFFEAEDAIDDVNAMDVKLDYCITPEKIYDFINSHG